MKYNYPAYDTRKQLEFTYSEWFENFINSLHEKNGNNKIYLSEKMENVIDKNIIVDTNKRIWINKDNTIRVIKHVAGSKSYIIIENITKNINKELQALEAELEYLREELKEDIETGGAELIEDSKQEIKRVIQQINILNKGMC